MNFFFNCQIDVEAPAYGTLRPCDYVVIGCMGYFSVVQ